MSKNPKQQQQMLTGFEITGRCYSDPTTFQFFEKPKNQWPEKRLALVYGRNGTGKSTISNALSKFDHMSLADEQDDQPVDSENREAPDGTPQCKNGQAELTITPTFTGESNRSTPEISTLVFNEDYIEENVKFRENGLDTIVLFGEQVDIEKKIEERRRSIESVETALLSADSEVEALEKNENQAYNNLKEGLKSGWARRRQKIRRNESSTPVTRERIRQIKSVALSEANLEDSLSSLNADIDKYLSIADAQLPDKNWEFLESYELSVTGGEDLLSKCLVPPTGTGIAEIVGENLKAYSKYVYAAHEIFQYSNIGHCPMCQQPVDQNYREELLNAISSSIDDAASKATSEIEASKISEIEFSGKDIDARLGSVAEEFEVARLKYNREISSWNEACDLKKNSLYSPVKWDGARMEEAVLELSTTIERLNAEYKSLLVSIHERSKEKERLEACNDIVSRLETKEAFRQYDEAVERMVLARKRQEQLRSDIENHNNQVAELVAESENVHIAAGEINDALSSIFAEIGRLELVLDTDLDGSKYLLRNRGIPLSPSNLSIGERNIVALVYFYTGVKKVLDDLYREDAQRYLVVVLDDPISSVDMDNRLGIHGFIESRILDFMSHDYEAFKLIILSHDLTVARQFEKSLDNVLFRASESSGHSLNSNQIRSQFARFQLDSDHTIRKIDQKALGGRSEYGVLLNAIWRIVKDDDILDLDKLLTLGNSLRRVLEAFSTFIYNDSSIPSTTLSKEYELVTDGRNSSVDLGPGHRLYLHGSSHSQDSITSLGHYGGFEGVTPEEQLIHVRKTLAFLYTLQPSHIIANIDLDERIVAEERLRSWCSELLGHDAAQY